MKRKPHAGFHATDVASVPTGVCEWLATDSHTRRQRIRKRTIGSTAAMVVLFVLGYFSLDIYWIARGMICGEALYAAKPTSYWRGIAGA